MIEIEQKQAYFGRSVKIAKPRVFTSGEDINKHSEIMWEAVKKEGNHLSKINASSRKNQTEWHGLFPAGQYVPEKGASPEGHAHFMIAPREKDNPHFLNIKDMKTEQLLPGAESVLEFLDKPNSLVGYNVTEDPEDLKRGAQSWRNLHLHFITVPVPESATQLDHPRKVLREPGYQRLEHVFRKAFEEKQKAQPNADIQIATAEEIKEAGYITHGSLALNLGDRMNPEKLANIMKSMDTFYRNVHLQYGTALFENYEDVKQSQWRETYQLRKKEEVNQHLSALDPSLTAEKKQSYIKTIENLLDVREKRKNNVEESGKSNLPEPKKLIFEGPCYSMSFFKKDDTYYGIFFPQLLRKSGAMEGAGLVIERKPSDDPKQTESTNRRNAAQEIFDRINATIDEKSDQKRYGRTIVLYDKNEEKIPTSVPR